MRDGEKTGKRTEKKIVQRRRQRKREGFTWKKKVLHEQWVNKKKTLAS